MRCKLNLHRWHYETKGQFFDGFMYPIRYRSCKTCDLKQVEIIEKLHDNVIWQNIKADVSEPESE